MSGAKRITVGSGGLYITSPIFIQCLVGVIGSFLYMYTVGKNYLFGSALIFVFLLCLFVYTQSASRANDTNSLMRVREEPRLLESTLFRPDLVLVLGIFAGIASAVVLTRYAGSLSPLQAARYYSNLRYNEETGMPVLVRGLNVILYFSAVVSNVVFFERARFRARGRWRYMMPSLLLLSEAFLLGTKSIVVLVAVYGLICWRYVALTHGFKMRHGRVYVRVALLSAVLVITSLGVQYARSGGRADLNHVAVKLFTSYLFVPFFALISIVADSFKFLSFGYSSIMGITGYFDSSIIQQQAPVMFDVDGQVTTTNVYTAYFYLIQDFGFVGLCIALLVLAALIGSLESKLKMGRRTAFPLYVCLSAYVLFAFAGPIFKYLTNILVFGLIFWYFAYSAAADGRNGVDAGRDGKRHSKVVARRAN